MSRKYDKCLLKGLGLAILYLGIAPFLWGMPSINVSVLFRDDNDKAPKIRKHWRTNMTNRLTLKLPQPILVVGLPKAGTSSLFGFFHCNGLYSQHWYCCGEQREFNQGGPGTMADCMLYNLQHDLYILEGCGDYDVYTEINGPRRMAGKIPWSHPRAHIFLPQHYYLQEIHEQYPQATLILNTRPTHEWVQSVRTWGNMLARQFANEVHSMEGSELPLPRGLQMDLFLTKLFDDHSALVKEFVKQHPSHTLIEVDISKNETGKVLADAFGLEERCWGHVNQNRDDASNPNRNHQKKKKYDEAVIPDDEHGRARYAKSHERAQQRRRREAGALDRASNFIYRNVSQP
jgi:hypothetical protein